MTSNSTRPLLLVTQESQQHAYDEEWEKFCKTITARIINGYYKPEPVGFRPAVNRLDKYEYAKMGVPDILFEGFAGE